MVYLKLKTRELADPYMLRYLGIEPIPARVRHWFPSPIRRLAACVSLSALDKYHLPILVD